MNTEIKHENFTVRRDKSRVLIRWFQPGVREQDRPELGIVLTKAGGIEVDREWLAAQDARRAHQEAWNVLLEKLDLPFRLHRVLAAAPPPKTMGNESAMLTYLRDLAHRRITIDGLGNHGRAVLVKAMGDERTGISKRDVSPGQAHRAR